MQLAFIVDECHRDVTPAQKRELDNFSIVNRYGMASLVRPFLMKIHEQKMARMLK
ncbi:hypothetical protein [uncultured Lactobacillus sp.]|uniref:hypothetical protein n=1 Tax=uncultured Lactobacillus sp. TaxID=153152 RepID=UPI0025E679A8|nr:hypothetical protein [uncultured Lactobacillus sp.]